MYQLIYYQAALCQCCNNQLVVFCIYSILSYPLPYFYYFRNVYISCCCSMFLPGMLYPVVHDKHLDLLWVFFFTLPTRKSWFCHCPLSYQNCQTSYVSSLNDREHRTTCWSVSTTSFDRNLQSWSYLPVLVPFTLINPCERIKLLVPWNIYSFSIHLNPNFFACICSQL